MRKGIRRISAGLALAVLAAAAGGPGCRKNPTPEAGREIDKFTIVSEIRSDRSSPYYVDFESYPADRRSLPIGIFDSGTGGLTVLDAVLKMDEYDNHTRQPGGDGLPDFVEEKFIYLGDKANMPYGRYDSEGKADFLRELILKDVQFLLGGRYYSAPEDIEARGKKPPVKAIVIACNTATAYGLDLVQAALKEWGLDMAVIGIVDAGARAAVSRMAEGDEPRLVGVFATEGTCASMGYPSAVKRNFASLRSGGVDILQQPGFGWAGAVDGDAAYIDPRAREVRGKDIYQGPGIGHPRYPIDPGKMREYRFDREGNALLVREDVEGGVTAMELNSVTNYIRYHVTRMVLEAAVRWPGRSLDAVILGCTHYPFFKREIREQFEYLRGLNDEFAAIIPPRLPLIDPAVSEAAALYEYLRRKNLFDTGSYRESRFFLSVPNPLLDQNRLNGKGEFTLEYKYGRSINRSRVEVKRVPFARKWLAGEVLERIRDKMPLIYEIMNLE